MVEELVSQLASDYVESRGSDDEVWIRTFKDPATKIRIIPVEGINSHGVKVTGSDSWQTFREHFEDGYGSYPCSNKKDECPGCLSTSPRTKKRTRKYYFNALDETGNVRVYKIGSVLWQTLNGRDKRIGSLSDRDYTIIHMGTTMNDTRYDPEPGEVYAIDFSDVKIVNIMEILNSAYADAVAHNSGLPSPRATAADAQVAAEMGITPAAASTNGRIQPASAAAATKQIKPAAAKTALAKPEVNDSIWGDAPSDEDIEAAETGVIKAWLDAKEVEYPSRAPRARLIEMAKKAAEPPF